jgi:hypothetical protein
MDRDADPALQGSSAGPAVSEAERTGELGIDAASGEIRMRGIEPEPERQRLDRRCAIVSARLGSEGLVTRRIIQQNAYLPDARCGRKNGYVLDPRDEVEYRALSIAAEAVEHVALEMYRAGGLRVLVKWTEDHALRASTPDLQAVVPENLLE